MNDATTTTSTRLTEEVDDDVPQPAFMPELHSWIFIPDSPTMRSSPQGASGSTSELTASEDATTEVTANVTAASVIIDSDEAPMSDPSSSPVTGPAFTATSAPVLPSTCVTLLTPLASSDVLDPIWPLTFPRLVAPPTASDAYSSAESSSSSDLDDSVKERLLGSRSSLALFAALLASHFGVLMLGYYLGSRSKRSPPHHRRSRPRRAAGRDCPQPHPPLIAQELRQRPRIPAGPPLLQRALRHARATLHGLMLDGPLLSFLR